MGRCGGSCRCGSAGAPASEAPPRPPAPAGTVFAAVARFRGETRTTELALGRAYRVEPLAPDKRAHRGRTLTLLALFDRNRHLDAPPPEGIVEPTADAALVRFSDTGALGRVSPEDLVPA